MKKFNLCFFAIFALTTSLYSAFQFGSKDSCIELDGDDAILFLESPMENFNGTLKFSNKKSNDFFYSILGAPIVFNKGILEKDESLMSFSGCLVNESEEIIFPHETTRARKSSSKLILTGGQTLDLQDALIEEDIEIKGPLNKIAGRPRFSRPIKLQNGESSLIMAIQNKLNQSIELNGGTLILENDLKLKDETKILGSGTINVNNFTLSLPASIETPYDGDIIFSKAKDVELTGYTTLNSTWTFSGEGETSYLVGNNNILNLVGGGVINVGANHTLNIVGVDIKGIGTSGGNIIIDATGEIAISKTALELDGNFYLSNGTISVADSECKLYIKQRDFIIITGPTGTLKVDNVIFTYEALVGAPVFPSPFFAMAGGQLLEQNSGQITRIGFDTADGLHEFPLSTAQGENTLTGGVDMNARTIVRYVNDTPETPKTMVMNGGGFKVRFDIADNQNITIDENTFVTIKNTIMEGINFSNVTLSGADETKAQFNFGDDCTIILNSDENIHNIAWDFVGNAVIDGNGYGISLSGAEKITTTDGKKLCIKNAYLKIDNKLALRCLNDNDTIELKNVVVYIGKDGLTLDKGSLIIHDNVKFFDSGDIPGISVFSFESKGNITIKSSSTLKIERGLKFNFSPDISNDEGNPMLIKKHLKFDDPSSTLTLKDSTFQIGPQGLTLDYGTVFITGNTALLMDPSPGAEFELGSAVDFIISNNATFDFNGEMDYFTSSYTPPT
jgi:hypothetical protein